MRRSRCTDDQIIGVLREHQAGVKTADQCRKTRRRQCRRVGDSKSGIGLQPARMSATFMTFPTQRPRHARQRHDRSHRHERRRFAISLVGSWRRHKTAPTFVSPRLSTA